MGKSSNIISALFIIAGIGIIIACFFLFLKDCQEEKLFYLNMVASCIVYLVLSVRSFDLFGTVERVAASGSSFGLKWTAVWTYVPLAVALIVISIVCELPFKYCLMGHLALLFILLLTSFMGSVVKENVNQSMEKIEARKSGLKEISDQLSLLEINCKMEGGDEYLELVNELKEGVRFITASDNTVAKTLEDRLNEKIQLISSHVTDKFQSSDVIKSEFNECKSLIELRKKQY